MTIRVLLAEDEALLRAGMVRLLERMEGVELVGEAQDLPELLDKALSLEPDVVVSDIRMPPDKTDEGVRAAVRLREERPNMGVILLTHHSDPGYAAQLLEAGSQGRAYLLKEHIAEVGQLAAAIKEVAAGGSVIDPLVVEDLVNARSSTRSSPVHSLSPRELEVLSLVAQGKSNAAVAEDLFITERSVEKHTASIFTKLGLAEEPSINRRVKAVVLFLTSSENTAPIT